MKRVKNALRSISGKPAGLFPRAMVCGFVLSFVFSVFPFTASCSQVSGEVLRLHVLANSDSEKDQQIKLLVRDAVLEEAARWTAGADDLDGAVSGVCTHLRSIEKAGQRVLDRLSVDQKVSAQVTDMVFSTRDYEGIRLPAGTYRTLRVTVGEGKGKNWWCVVFPALCLPAAGPGDRDVLAELSPREAEILTHPERYEVRFKVVELYERLRSRMARR